VYSYEREIYTFEARADATDKTCLVIGGYYNGALSYYRVDFADEAGARLSLLRNHNYRVVIKEVTAAGYPSYAEALANEPFNIVVTITESDGMLGLIAFDAHNYLGASTGEFALQGKPYTGQQFTVSTDVAGGWEITGTDGDWITIDTPASLSGGPGAGSVTFDVDVNDTGARRVGYIHFQAGRLTLDVKVTQLGVGVWITDAGDTREIQELVFESMAGKQPVEQQFMLHWVPSGALVNSMSFPASGYPVLTHDPAHAPGEGSLSGISGPPGKTLVTLQPAALLPAEVTANPYVEKASMVRFVAFHDGDFAPADVKARHLNYHTSVINVKSYYVLGGGTHSFTVRGNTAWTIDHVENDIGIQNARTSGGYNTTGQALTFELAHDNSKDGQIAKIILVDPTGWMDNIEVPIRGVACGLNGTAYSKTIGSNSYDTHAYGSGANQRCWMVANSMEGTYSGKGFGRNASGADLGTVSGTNGRGSVNGYYYTYTQANTANNACPTGWRLFTNAEASVLMTAVNNDKNGIGKWWWLVGSKALAGCYHTSASTAPNTWANWNQYGYWWGAGTLELGSGAANLETVQYGNRAAYWFSVRCVQN
jgi:uncharacterized protein (TIGR02145 family)